MKRAWILVGCCVALATVWARLEASQTTERPNTPAPVPALRVPPSSQVKGSTPRLRSMPVSSAAQPLSHPRTERHHRLERQRDLLRQLSDAFDLHDPERLRPLAQQLQHLDPSDVHALAEGYLLLADCLENPDSDATLARAQVYYDRRRASTLRRFVRRTCLEPGP